MHTDIFEKFESIFPDLAKNVTDWFPCGKNGIRVRMQLMDEYVFIYNDCSCWSYETIDSYIRKIRGDK